MYTFEIFDDIPSPPTQRSLPKYFYCRTPVLGLGLGVDFTFAWNNNNNNKDNNDNDKNPHLNFLKGTVLGNKEQGIRDKTRESRY